MSADTSGPKTVVLDPETIAAQQRMTANANQTPEEIQAKLNQNLEMAGNLGQGDQQIAQQSASTGMPTGQLRAIRGLYAKEAGPAMEELKNQNLRQSEKMKADYLNQTAKIMIGQHQQAANQFQVITNAYTQQEAARAAAISSMFQVADTGMGMAAANNRNTSRQTSPNAQSVGGYDPNTSNVGSNPSATYMSPQND